jgi:hypothetical protein
LRALSRLLIPTREQELRALKEKAEAALSKYAVEEIWRHNKIDIRQGIFKPELQRREEAVDRIGYVPLKPYEPVD